jgi:hypothetical protein
MKWAVAKVTLCLSAALVAAVLASGRASAQNTSMGKWLFSSRPAIITARLDTKLGTDMPRPTMPPKSPGAAGRKAMRCRCAWWTNPVWGWHFAKICIAQARYEFVAFVDDDSWVLSGMGAGGGAVLFAASRGRRGPRRNRAGMRERCAALVRRAGGMIRNMARYGAGL